MYLCLKTQELIWEEAPLWADLLHLVGKFPFTRLAILFHMASQSINLTKSKVLNHNSSKITVVFPLFPLKIYVTTKFSMAFAQNHNLLQIHWKIIPNLTQISNASNQDSQLLQFSRLKFVRFRVSLGTLCSTQTTIWQEIITVKLKPFLKKPHLCIL